MNNYCFPLLTLFSIVTFPFCFWPHLLNLLKQHHLTVILLHNICPLQLFKLSKGLQFYSNITVILTASLRIPQFIMDQFSDLFAAIYSIISVACPLDLSVPRLRKNCFHLTPPVLFAMWTNIAILGAVVRKIVHPNIYSKIFHPIVQGSISIILQFFGRFLSVMLSNLILASWIFCLNMLTT